MLRVVSSLFILFKVVNAVLICQYDFFLIKSD